MGALFDLARGPKKLCNVARVKENDDVLARGPEVVSITFQMPRPLGTLGGTRDLEGMMPPFTGAQVTQSI